MAHRSKIRIAKKFGQKDVDPLFKLPRIPAEAIRDLQDELSEFELPARQLDAEIMDEFHSQASEIRQRGKDHRSSIHNNLHHDTRIISWNDINKSMDLPHVHQQTH